MTDVSIQRHICRSYQNATRRDAAGLADFILRILLQAVDIAILHLTVPSLIVALEPNRSHPLWFAEIYRFTVSGFLIAIGNTRVWIGRRSLLGATAFAAASVFAASLLILARALLGIDAAVAQPKHHVGRAAWLRGTRKNDDHGFETHDPC